MEKWYVETVQAMNHAIRKHGVERTPLGDSMFDSERLVVLVEEVGEVARAITYDEKSTEQLVHELYQVAAMAVMWAQQASRRQG